MNKQNFFTKLFSGKNKSLDLSGLQSDLVGWHTTGMVNSLKYYKGNQYENGYASIQAIAKQFSAAAPYAIDANGKKLKQANIIDTLAHPNTSMSAMDFREALAVMSLVHDKVYIRAHRPAGQRITEGNIEGLTFMEDVMELDFPEGRKYQTPDGSLFGENEVIVLKGINPYNLDQGYSVANAARRWANIDDYIASYQAGFFENGAVPAGQFIISAPTPQEYEDIAHNLKMKNRGGGKNSGVVYSYAPIDPATGKSAGSSIQWVPFNTTNKDLALKDIFEQVNQKIDSAYGVPASMRGVNTNNTYASVRVDQQIFIDNAVRPFADKVWDRLTHELNRITGGLGYAIVVLIETPNVAEEELANAQTQQTTVNTLMVLVNKGFSLASSVKALKLPDEYLLLELDKTAQTAPVVATDVPTVDNGNEVADSPDQADKTKALDPLTVNCKHCGRYLFKSTGTTVVEDMPCPKCKAKLNFKIINPLGDDVTHTFSFQETEPRKLKEEAEEEKETNE